MPHNLQNQTNVRKDFMNHSDKFLYKYNKHQAVLIDYEKTLQGFPKPCNEIYY